MKEMASVSSSARVHVERFTQRRLHWAQDIPLERFARARDWLAHGSGKMGLRVRGERALLCGREFPVFHFNMRGEVPLICPRCLESLPYQLDHYRRFFLRSGPPSAEEEAALDAESDIIKYSVLIDLVSLAEEEFILALPVFLRHEVCARPDSDGKKDTPSKSVHRHGDGVPVCPNELGAGSVDVHATNPDRPFAVLQHLLQRSRD